MAELEKKKTKANRAWEKELQDKEEKIRGVFFSGHKWYFCVILCRWLIFSKT